MDELAFTAELRAFCDERVAAGQHALSMIARRLLYLREPALLDRLDFDDDAVFLEPLLIARLSQPDLAPEIGATPLVAARLPAADRTRGIDAVSDSHGVIELPGAGALAGLPPGAQVRVAWRDGRPTSEPPGELVAACAIAGGPELARFLHPLLRPLFRAGATTAIDVDAGVHHAEHLRAAFDRLAALCPSIHRTIIATTRRLVVFSADDHNSFADLRAHGTAFSCATLDDDDVFLVEDLAHQCAHVAFGAITTERGDFLAVPADTPLPAIDSIPGEDRTVYTALHGVFTEAWMVQALGSWLARDPPAAGSRRRHELEGRLAFIVRRFGSDLSNLARGAFFTPLGDWLVGQLERVFAAAFARWRSLVLGADFVGHPYNFSYASFARANPPSAP